MIKLIPQVNSIKYVSDKRIGINHIALGNSLLSENARSDFLEFCSLPTGDVNIAFVPDETMQPEEYTIVTDDVIVIRAGGGAGQLYALQTLKQLFLQTDFLVPSVEIHDKPRYRLRGFMLDVGRYFFPVDSVKQIIRRMACHKLNLLHLHLTEDQGWRVEIKKYPLLTEKGSKRTGTNFSRRPHSGFYTQEDIREIVAFAGDFCITVMPEFDIPGHTTSAIACYNELQCFPRKTEVATHWGVKHDVLCVGRDSTIEFVKDVIDELCELFPDGYFHIGGDEVPKHRWSLCPDCRRRMTSLGLADCDELQAWFMNEINSYCRQKGKQTFMWSWDVRAENQLDESLGYTKCGDASCGDRPFIDTSTAACYIDLPYGYISLKNSCEHKISDGNCLGVEAALWSEYVPDMKKADYMTFPRLAPICELGWCGSSDYEGIMERLDFYYSFLDRNGYGYADIRVAQPNRLRALAQGLWFEKRQLTWEGLTNIIKDKAVEKIAKEK